jgi:HNH endonuclease domain-containing protein
MMTIKQIEVTVGDIARGYINNEEQGVRGYGGQLDIRPPYQREFIYNENEQQAVISTVLKGYPLNVMYWVRRSEDAECPYEVMDGQQRTLSLCEYVDGKFAYEFKNFFNQPADIQKLILDYPLTIYLCEGEPSEKLEWFKTINIAGKPLNEQEINNAVYAGPFVTDAKRHFSKSNCGAYRLGKDLVNGTPIRQEFLKKALEWMAEHETREGKPQSVVGYMAEHQHDPNANNLWTYFQNVLNWTITNFDLKKFKKIMKGLNWALYYDKYHSTTLDTADLASRISKLILDSDVQKQMGIIPYVLTGDERHLDLRGFPEDIKLAVWEKQHHICPSCQKEFDYEFMEGDHITPWREGGRTVIENCQMLCRECNRRKGGR